MSAFSFGIAAPSDDVALRDLIRRMPMPGAIRIAFEREPNFSASQTVEGRFHETVVCRHNSDGMIVGMGCRSVKTVFLNGQPVPVGYLSSLRLLPAYRGARLVAGGYRYFRERHRDGLTRFYLTTIVEDNAHALSVLASGRPGLPAYHDFGRYYCAAIKVPGKDVKPPSSALNIRPATPADIFVLSEFLSREGAVKQFFPAYEPDDFRNGGGLLRSLKPSDIVLGFDGKTLVAAMSAWDQSAFRQTRIVGYNALVGAARLPLNALARALGYPRLPAPGSCLNAVCLSLICVRRNDPELFSHMLDHLLARLCGRHELLLAGFHETDPLLQPIRQRRHVSYTSRLFVVCWEDGENDIRSLDPHRIPYLELGSL